MADLLSVCQCRRHGFNPWSGKIPHALEKLSPRATTSEPVLQSLSLNERSHRNEKPVHCNQRVAPTCHSQRKPWCRNEDPVQLKIDIINKYNLRKNHLSKKKNVSTKEFRINQATIQGRVCLEYLIKSVGITPRMYSCIQKTGTFSYLLLYL